MPRTILRTDRDIRLMANVREPSGINNDIVSVAFTVVWITGENKPLNLMYGSHYDEDRELGCYDALSVRAQANVDRDDNQGFYGWDVTYEQPFTVRADRARSMAKTLTAIERFITLHCQTYGYPADYASYLAIVAQAIGAGKGGPPFLRAIRPSSLYQDLACYGQMDTDALRRWLTQMVADLRKARR